MPRTTKMNLKHMKAICLHQPWASLMAYGIKRNETRGRAWMFRGDVAICATQMISNHVYSPEMEAMIVLWGHRRLFGNHANVRDLYHSLPRGAVVCVVEKTGCLSTNYAPPELTAIERAVGNYNRNRFYFPTTNCRRLARPVPVIGHQGVFELPDDVLAKVLEQLCTQG